MQNQSLIFQLGQMLGFDDGYLKKLHKDYQQSDEDQRYQIMEILWEGFLQLLNRLTALKYQQYLTEVAAGKRSLDSDLYQQAQAEVKQYLLKLLTGEIKDEQEIEALRQKIYTLSNSATSPN